jgi:hypothetical protein
MPTDTTTEAAPAQSTNEMPSPMQETPSSTVDSLPQSEGDFASWLSDRLDKFEKGEEKAPWETEGKAEEAEAEASEDTPEPEKEEDKASEEPSKEEETEETEDSEETKNMSESAGAKFKELKAELKTYKTKVAELEKAVEEAKTSPQSSEEVEKLRSQLAEYEQEIAVSRVEATPEFKRAVLEPTQAILDTAAAMAERYKINTGKLVNALREESQVEGSDALTELAADFSERDRVRLYRMADDLADVARRRDYLRENASQAMAEMQERQAAYEKEESARAVAEMSAAVDRTWDDLFSKKSFISNLDSKTLEEAKRHAKETDYYSTPPDERAYAVYSGLILPQVVTQLEASQSKVAELEKALAKYKKATPKVSGNTDTAPVGAVDDGGFLDAIEKRFTLG